MGASESVLSAEQLDEYAELTYLTRWEVLLILKKLQSLAPDGLVGDLQRRFPCRKIMDVFPQLKVRNVDGHLLRLLKKAECIHQW